MIDGILRERFQQLMEKNHFHTPESVEGAEIRRTQLRRDKSRAEGDLGRKTTDSFYDQNQYNRWRKNVENRIQDIKFEIGFLNRYIAVQNAEAQYGSGAFNIFGSARK